MADPSSLAGVGLYVLMEGAKFLFDQAREVLKSWRGKKAGGTDPPPATVAQVPAPICPVPPVFEGDLHITQINYAAADRLAEPLREARRDLADLLEGIDSLSVDNPEHLARIDAVRRLMEVALSQRITFKGEQRPPCGPLIAGEVDVDAVRGYAAAVRAGSVRGGTVEGRARVKEVVAGGELYGVDVGDVDA